MTSTNDFLRELATMHAATTDRNKLRPTLTFGCEILSERLLLGRAINNIETELLLGRLYACKKDNRRFVYLNMIANTEGFVSSIDPFTIVTLSELDALPYPSSIYIVANCNQPQLVESIGWQGDGTSYWLAEPRWSETKSWLAEHVPVYIR